MINEVMEAGTTDIETSQEHWKSNLQEQSKREPRIFFQQFNSLNNHNEQTKYNFNMKVKSRNLNILEK